MSNWFKELAKIKQYALNCDWIKDFHKYEKLEYKKNKLKLDIDFLNSCKQLGVYPKFLIFNMLNVSNKDTWSINKTLFCSAINNRNKELRNISKELSISENVISKQLSTTDFYILEKSITSHNKKSLQISLYTHHKKIIITDEGLHLTYIHS